MPPDSITGREFGRLAASDWTQMPDALLAAEQREAWRAYRQALRDVPQQAGFPEAVAWPTPPSA